jgi:hypothetical protein
LALKFGSDSRFEGQLVGALERMESGGTMRVLDGLFVTRERESGELSAISLSESPPSGRISRILGFRLDASERKTATQRALAGAAGETVRSLAAVMTPGTAIATVLVERAWAALLTDAVARVGGTEVLSELIDASSVSELTPRLLSAAEQGHRPSLAVAGKDLIRSSSPSAARPARSRGHVVAASASTRAAVA